MYRNYEIAMKLLKLHQIWPCVLFKSFCCLYVRTKIKVLYQTSEEIWVKNAIFRSIPSLFAVLFEINKYLDLARARLEHRMTAWHDNEKRRAWLTSDASQSCDNSSLASCYIPTFYNYIEKYTILIYYLLCRSQKIQHLPKLSKLLCNYFIVPIDPFKKIIYRPKL